ncbi:MAG: hypothetical protein ACOC35_10075 [Promethearchaeia archaeon]
MPQQDKKDSGTRKLPKSLRGIETILRYLYEKDGELCSIRNISKMTGLSMRVTKNILLQLDRLNQVKRVVEKNKVLPKWTITKLGKKVVKKSEFKETDQGDWASDMTEYLLKDILIPDEIETMNEAREQQYKNITAQMKSLQGKISKILGPVLNLDNPALEDKISTVFNKLKECTRRASNLPQNPVKAYKIKKSGEKRRKVTTDEAHVVFAEIYFFESLIGNLLTRIRQIVLNLSETVENGALSSVFSVAEQLREKLRQLDNLISKREAIGVHSHILSEEKREALMDNEISADLIEDVIEPAYTNGERSEELRDIVLKIHGEITSQKQDQEQGHEIPENMPLYRLYQLILDKRPQLYFSIEELENIISQLADEGYIPGIRIIQSDEDHYLKVVQFEAHDFSKDELELISKALELEKFGLTDMVGELGWSTEQVRKTLAHLTEMGILKYSKSFLHGDRWYIVAQESG